MRRRLHELVSFPNPVNEIAARSVAAGVVLLVVAALATRSVWVVVPLAYGFWARVLTGPSLSPLGQLATRVIARRLPVAPRPVPGAPKRFAQGIGTAFSTTALILWLVGDPLAAQVVLVALALAASLEAVLGLCLGCRAFAVLIRLGLVPASVCEDCADISRRIPQLSQSA